MGITFKKCPNCDLTNPETSMQCKCGYDFSSGQITESSPQREFASVLTRLGAISIDGLILLPFYIPIFVTISMVEIVRCLQRNRSCPRLFSWYPYWDRSFLPCGTAFSVWEKRGSHWGESFSTLLCWMRMANPLGRAEPSSERSSVDGFPV